MSGHDPQTTDKQSTGLGIIARLWWMLLGNAILAFSILFIVENKDGFFRIADLVFWTAVGTLVLVRYLDIRLLNGLTVTGSPASIRHWVKYVAILVACSTTTWALAHAVNYWLGSGGSKG
jgi:hypothetical protein